MCVCVFIYVCHDSPHVHTFQPLSQNPKACAVVRVVGSILERFEKQGFQAGLLRAEGFEGFQTSPLCILKILDRDHSTPYYDPY